LLLQNLQKITGAGDNGLHCGAFGAHGGDLEDGFDRLAAVRVDFLLHSLPYHAPLSEAVSNAGSEFLRSWFLRGHGVVFPDLALEIGSEVAHGLHHERIVSAHLICGVQRQTVVFVVGGAQSFGEISGTGLRTCFRMA